MTNILTNTRRAIDEAGLAASATPEVVGGHEAVRLISDRSYNGSYTDSYTNSYIDGYVNSYPGGKPRPVEKPIEVYLVRSSNDYFLTDLGHTFAHLRTVQELDITDVFLYRHLARTLFGVPITRGSLELQIPSADSLVIPFVTMLNCICYLDEVRFRFLA